MSKRKKIFQLIDSNMENEGIANHVKDYISNLCANNAELAKKMEQKRKKPKVRRPKSKHVRGMF